MKQALMILMAVCLYGCGQATDQAPPPVWKSQLDLRDKAQAVDAIVQQQDAEQRRRLDEMAQ